MQICKTHWAQMKEAVEERGLGALVSSSAEEAVDRSVAELEGRADPATWDPLLAMLWNFYGRAVQQGGLYLMSEPPADEGHVETPDGSRQYCPLCEVRSHGGGADADCNWIETCADAMLAYARAQQLVPVIQ